jgi:hypothetical protein
VYLFNVLSFFFFFFFFWIYCLRPDDHIMVATTKLINGNTLIESLFETFGQEEFPLGAQSGSTAQH